MLDYNKKYKRLCKCKKCGEICEVDDSQVRTSIPPQYTYNCKNCGLNFVQTNEVWVEEMTPSPDDIINDEKIIQGKSECLNGDCAMATPGQTSTIIINTENYKLYCPCCICGEPVECDINAKTFVAVCDSCKEAIKWVKKKMGGEK